MVSDGQRAQKDRDAYLFWEKADGLGEKIRAFLPLCAAILFRPALFFSAVASLECLELKRRLWRAFVFALILGYLKLFLDVVNIYWFGYFAKNFLAGPEQLQISLLSTAVMQSPFFILRPLINFILVFFVLSISIKLTLGFDKKLFPLFLVMCYKSVVEIFYLLPFVGGFIALIWSLFLLIIGLREFYRVNTIRLIFAGLVMPFLVSIFLIMAVGPSLNNIILSIYPETRSQIVKINEASAFISVQDIVAAILKYEQELGFYPAHLGVLDKFIDRRIAGEGGSSSGVGGYIYQYDKIDESHFTLLAEPSQKNVTGRLTFYSDESEKIRLDNRDGRQIQNVNEAGDLILDNKG